MITLISPSWSQQCARLYSTYRLYEQSSEVDQLVFSPDGSAAPRARRVLDAVLPALAERTGPILDFGCGTGALLAEVGRSIPGRELIGFDFDDAGQDGILAIPDVVAFYTDWDAIANSLGCVLMTHVLEHLEFPVGTLERVYSSLRSDGILLVQVPDVVANPFMLCVGDHATHFDMASLLRLVGSAGFSPVLASNSIVAGELTLLAVPKSQAEIQGQETPSSLEFTRAEGLVDTLAYVGTWLESLSRAGKPWGIFGTSIAGTWAALTVSDEFDFWVDEDPSRVGRKWHDRPILAPQSVAASAAVAVVLAETKSRDVIARAASGGFPGRYLAPPVML